MAKYSLKNSRRRKNQKKHTKRKLRRGKSRKVMMGGMVSITRNGIPIMTTEGKVIPASPFIEYGGSLPRLLTMKDILIILEKYDNEFNTKTLESFKSYFNHNLGNDELQVLSMYSLSELRVLKFENNNVNKALFEHPYTLEEIVEIMIKLNQYSSTIMEFEPEINNYKMTNALKDIFSNNGEECEFNLKQNAIQRFRALMKALKSRQPEHLNWVELLNNAIRKFHNDRTKINSDFKSDDVRKVLGDYMSL